MKTVLTPLDGDLSVSYVPNLGIVEIDGLGCIAADRAVKLAAQLVFLVDGHMVNGSTDGAIHRHNWNLRAPFFTEYAKLMGSVVINDQ